MHLFFQSSSSSLASNYYLVLSSPVFHLLFSLSFLLLNLDHDFALDDDSRGRTSCNVAAESSSLN